MGYDVVGIDISKVGIDQMNAIAIEEGLTLKGIYGREMYETWYHMEMMLTTGLDITSIITHRFKADDFQKALGYYEQYMTIAPPESNNYQAAMVLLPDCPKSGARSYPISTC